MSDRAEFLHAIQINPDADAPRLLLADWLEEQGDADWARFIRLSCDAAKSPKDSGNPEPDLQERCELYFRIQERMLEGLADLPGLQWGDGLDPRQRGLREAVVVSSPRTLVAEIDPIIRRTCLRFVTLMNPTIESLAEVLQLPQIATWHSLALVGWPAVTDEAVEQLLACPNLPRLRWLRLDGGKRSQLTNGAIRLLAESPLMDQLTRLDLQENLPLELGSAPMRSLKKRCGDTCELLLPQVRRTRRRR
ncbi:TIGR02996 domain-containing protein [Tuwongella immobilis]|uniref:Repeat-companion domain protein n=1 Tax=Tuwongella immobilis TaxID=692036 RepID=A0A6C2YI08_9BACT|nr:TIGR02996 domain-containing protein [Tuwongella immobilis]VIP01004.1 Repeat-companion domain protein OS=Isosphaera pallida (strain ATCC 43644 / DSM 9630 / IS1B) GN=Isop_0537 PE=4 SV=1 [Tuwongella immobilis]VTR97432.1 Repeat-companion domain protein OS=Isosphaera pallida (strain ATCC 43644 / DSM 9630 / IS1B) GN=Isop_0537 PE=4 SV=1 [Tuwongella immobilis]